MLAGKLLEMDLQEFSRSRFILDVVVEVDGWRFHCPGIVLLLAVSVCLQNRKISSLTQPFEVGETLLV